MEAFELEPKYSTNEIAGKCLKCLGEEELNFCLSELLKNEGEDEDIKRRYELLVAFLKSPDFEPLRQESERLLSEGQQVKLRARTDTVSGKTEYTLIQEEKTEE